MLLGLSNLESKMVIFPSAEQLSDRHYAIVLAAGASTRMGTCKAQLAWEAGKSLLTYQIEQFLFAGIVPIVVLGLHNANCQQYCVPESIVAINPSPDRGKTSSILTGLSHLPKEFGSLTISAVDQPRPSWVYQVLLQAHTQAVHQLITAPTYQGRMGHPLIFSKTLLPHLQNLDEASMGLRRVVKAFDALIHRVEFDTAEVCIDLNTPDRYQAAYQLKNDRRSNSSPFHSITP